jgi:PelA/Pel-15E family pectate lyase
MKIRAVAFTLAVLASPGLALEAGAATLDAWGAAALEQSPGWYSSDEAREVADKVLAYQSNVGAWPKNTDFLAPATSEMIRAVGESSSANTIDNDATTRPLRFLALVANATDEVKYQRAFLRGLDYLLEAQYENGGWPQFYPLRPGYYSRITYNDNAMMNVMFLLRGIAFGGAPYAFVDDAHRDESRHAVERGFDCILKTQLRQQGGLTAWAAQYDEVTLEPAWARAYEPPSLSGNESVAIVRFLMELETPTAEHTAAIEGAVRWLRAVAIEGKRYVRGPNADGLDDAVMIDDPGAGQIWARFYEIGSNRPIFLGRDSVVRYSLAEIETERRGGYAYYGTWPAALLDEDYPRWLTRNRAGGE